MPHPTATTRFPDPPHSPRQARERIAATRFLNAFITVCDEHPDAAGPIVAVKDLIDVRGVVTTCGGPVGADARPAADDAEVVALLRRQGADIVGKTNLYEWAFGVGSDNVHHGDVLNPRDTLRSAGGSSGGSAAAVAAGLCDWALGTDTAGSVRIPAALCRVVGFKPTHGAVAATGVMPLAPSHDTVGVLAPSVAVAREAAHAIGVPAQADGEPAVTAPRLAVPEGWVTGLDPAVLDAWDAACGSLPQIAYPDRDRLFALSTRVQAFEAFQIHQQALTDHPERYAGEVRERLAVGGTVSQQAYDEGRAQLRELAAVADEALRDIDALALPTTACVAPLLSEPTPREPLTRFTRPFNATGQPAISIPFGPSDLLAGLQIVGRRGDDDALLQLAAAVAARLAETGAPV